MDAVHHLLRRSRLRSFAAAAHRALPIFPQDEQLEELGSIDVELRKRLTPEQLESMQSSARASAIRAASEEAAAAAAETKVTTTARTAATVTTSTHSAYVFSDKYGRVTSTSAAPAITSESAVKSSAASSAARSSSSSSASSSSSSTSSSSTVRSSSAAASVAPTTSIATVRTITQTPSAVSSASASASVASVAAANASETSEGLSTGAIAGIVVAVLVSVVVVGSAIGWLYRKYTTRSYSSKAPWAKIDDDDITPFPQNEKYGDDDIYGGSTAPVIGSRRALAMARQNAFNEDGSYRPDSQVVLERGDNRAGVGAGNNPMYGAYPNLPSPYYGVDPQGRPYNPQAGRVPMTHMYDEVPSGSPHAISAPGNTRQLVGPNGYPQPELSPHALGRPAAPVSNFAIAQHEDFADMPEPLTPTNVDYTPRTATTIGEWAGDARPPQGRSRVSMTTPRGMGGEAVDAARMSPTEMLRPMPAAAFPVAAPNASTPSTLPSFEPMSPLMTGFDLRRSSTQPLAMYEDEKAEQKRMYGEVAQTAGVPEPPTPKSALNDSTSTYETTSSFSAHEPIPRLPSLTVNPPQPYVHGRPLSPLTEMPTPMSTSTRMTDAPIPSSSILHEANPYERTLLGAKQHPAAPPYSAASTTGATGFPSPAYPPPSPGGMSVPGSVTDSPQRWEPRARQSFDEEDAYGGI